jgi:class III lanthionine synthetase
MSSIEKFTFSLAHPEFYEPPGRFATEEDQYRRRLRELLPADWKVLREGIWLHCAPPDSRIVSQGWKIHLSAVTHNALALFQNAVPILVGERTSFKIAAAPAILSLLTSKQWQRGGAGKCMTVYPFDAAHFMALIEALHQATIGHHGPYILSDRRYKDSKCVFYRYGGIAPRTALSARGERLPYLLSPDGERIPDRRQARFILPPWVKDPFAQDAPPPLRTGLKNGRYTPEAALRHTNSGGLYLATDHQTGEKVVLKEARPLTNVDPASGKESKDLLVKEHRLLTTLAGTRTGPRAIDLFEEWEHCFLVEEYLDGITLRQHSILHNVARFSRPSPTHFAEFYAEFRSVFTQLAQVLETFGQRGIVFRDLSPTNVIVLKDGQVRLVDFEAATELGVDPMSNLFTPGFASSDHFASGVPRVENDYFSLGALMLAYLMPMHAALGLDPLLHHRFIQALGDDYGFPESLLGLLHRLMSREPSERPAPAAVIAALAHPSPARAAQIHRPSPISDAELGRALSGILRYTLAQASCDRTDRLFPCDPKAFATNPLGLAYGACGTLYALHKLTGEAPAPLIDWVFRQEITAESYAPGLYVGMAGIAWVLLELGYAERARKVLAASANHPVPPTYDVFYGLAGWGMAQLKFHQVFGEPQYLEAATAAGRELVKTRVVDGNGCHWIASPDEVLFGYAHGAAGVSLFLLHLYLASGDFEFLRVGQEALEYDLAQAVDLGDGLLWPSRTGPQRTLIPYWRYGSAGIGTVLLRYLRVVDNPRYRDLLRSIKQAATRKYAIFPNRGFGLAGLGDFLIDMADHGIDAEECMEAARTVATGIMLFHLDRGEEGIAFPGADLWKVSCDYTTGSAGIALFFDRLLRRGPADFLLDERFSNATQNESGGARWKE